MKLDDEAYLCPRCRESLPLEHQQTYNSNGDVDGWKCPDGEIVWVWVDGWRLGRGNRDDYSSR